MNQPWWQLWLWQASVALSLVSLLLTVRFLIRRLDAQRRVLVELCERAGIVPPEGR